MKSNLPLDLTLDIVFKTIWYHGNKYVRKYLMRMLSYVIGEKLEDYDLGPSEQGVLSYEQIASRVDILLVSKDKKSKINVEMNRLNKEKTSKKSIKMSENKSMIYLGNMIASYYNDLEDKYESDIDIKQVNLNTFYCPYDKTIEKLRYKFCDIERGITKSNINTVDLYLPRTRDLWYDKQEEEKKDIAFLLCQDYEEREKLAISNKEREETLKLVKKLERDDRFMCMIDREEYEKAIYESEKREEIAEAREEGLEQGLKQGKNETIMDMIKSMFKNGASLELISKSANKSIKEVKSILKIS